MSQAKAQWIKENLKAGETYAGIILGKDGAPDQHLILLPGQAKDHAFLFADAGQLVLKANDDLIATIKTRIAEHKAAEDKRLEDERAKIRKEEEAKAQAAAQAAAPQPSPTLGEVLQAVAPPEIVKVIVGESTTVPAGTVIGGIAVDVPTIVTDVINGAPFERKAAAWKQIEDLIYEMHQDDLSLVLHYCERLIAQRKPAEAA